MKKSIFNQVHVLFSSLLIFILHIPFVFAKAKPMEQTGSKGKTLYASGKLTTNSTGNSAALLYDSMHLDISGLSQQAFKFAVKGFQLLKGQGQLMNDHIISIVDFSKPSSQKRLYVIDLQEHSILFNTYVAHGQGSGKEFADHFSNIPESLQSSLGFYITTDTYNGKNGYSLHLNGMEQGINDKADSRAIVMHGAPYVSESFIRAQGYLGRSWGCPAIPVELCKPIIEKIKEGTCLFIYGNNEKYLRKSKIINS